MKKSILLTGCVCLFLLCVTPDSFAQNYIYSVPPPNDTSLNYTPSSHLHTRYQTRHHHRYHHRHHHRHYYAVKTRHHLHHKAGALYIYYALPATACCGDTWQLHKTRCCAQPGVWSKSPYATFKPAPNDFIYSATNDDDTRPYDMYWDVIVDDTLEDPDY